MRSYIAKLSAVGVSFIVLLFCALNTLKISAIEYKTLSIQIPIECLHVEKMSQHDYIIKIESLMEFQPQPKEDILTINDNGTGEFEIDIYNPGSFYYKIYELEGDNSNIVYDNRVYEIEVYVENLDERDLTYALTINELSNGHKPDKVEFLNTILGETDPVSTTTTITTDDYSVDTQTTAVTTVTDSYMTNGNVTTTTTVTTETTTETTNIIDKTISVLTGDKFNLVAFVTLLLLTAGLSVIMLVIGKKDNDKEEDKHDED